VTIRRDSDSRRTRIAPPYPRRSRTDRAAVLRAIPQRSFVSGTGLPLAAEKRRIGRAAAALIKHGETIALTPGTTTTKSFVEFRTITTSQSSPHSEHRHGAVEAQGYQRVRNRRVLARRLVFTHRPTAMHALDQLVSMRCYRRRRDRCGVGCHCFNSDEAALNGTMVKHAQRKSRLSIAANLESLQAGASATP